MKTYSARPSDVERRWLLVDADGRTLGRLATLKVMIIASAVAMPALYLMREQVALFYILVAAVYWCYGTQLSVFASTSADFYGTKHLGMNYGVLFTAWGVAGILGPIIGARVFDTMGDYRYAFFAASGDRKSVV